MKALESSVLEREDGKAEERKERFTFPKSARLHHRTLVNTLFSKGRSVYVYPLRATWRVLSQEELQASFRDVVPMGIGPVQLMVTIPKKKRRHAVDRVRMRRLVKETFRLRRSELTELIDSNPGWRTLSLAFVYISDKNEEFATINKKMGVLFKKLKEAIKSDSPAACHLPHADNPKEAGSGERSIQEGKEPKP